MGPKSDYLRYSNASFCMAEPSGIGGRSLKQVTVATLAEYRAIQSRASNQVTLEALDWLTLMNSEFASSELGTWFLIKYGGEGQGQMLHNCNSEHNQHAEI
jgi:hypothetical protein